MTKKFFLLSVLAMLLLSACSQHTCPTYDNNSGDDKYSGGKKSKTSKGLFPKNM